MICARCTSCRHLNYNPTQSWNTTCLGQICDYGCGLLIHKGLDVFNLPNNIPEEYKEYFYDIDWFIFIQKIEYYIDMYNYYKSLPFSDIENLRNSIDYRYNNNNIEYILQGYNTRSEWDEDSLTVEEKEFKFVISCFNDRFT
jgi:hypothetical protein